MTMKLDSIRRGFEQAKLEIYQQDDTLLFPYSRTEHYRDRKGQPVVVVQIQLTEDGKRLSLSIPYAFQLDEHEPRGQILRLLLARQNRQRRIRYEFDPQDGEVQMGIALILEDNSLDIGEVIRLVVLLVTTIEDVAQELQPLRQLQPTPTPLETAFTLDADAPQSADQLANLLSEFSPEEVQKALSRSGHSEGGATASGADATSHPTRTGSPARLSSNTTTDSAASSSAPTLRTTEPVLKWSANLREEARDTNFSQSLSKFDIPNNQAVENICTSIKSGRYLPNLLYINQFLAKQGYPVDNHQAYFFDSNVLVSDRNLQGFLIVNMDGFYSNCINRDELTSIFSWDCIDDIEYHDNQYGSSVNIIGQQGVLTISKKGIKSLKVLFYLYKNIWRQINEKFSDKPIIAWNSVSEMGIKSVSFSSPQDYFQFKLNL